MGLQDLRTTDANRSGDFEVPVTRLYQSGEHLHQHRLARSTRADDQRHLALFLEHLSDQARMPSTTNFYVLPGLFKEALARAPRADINIFGLSVVSGKLPMGFIREVPRLVNTSSVFVIDSGHEDALV